MINYETILSTFDDKLTLLQWLQKVEQALQGAGLERVDITQVTPTTAVFKFTFADGTSLTTPSITLPRGPKGDTGATGATGATGNGIASITKTGTSGLIDTYTVLYTNGSTDTFTVTNGADGEEGNGIASIEKTSTVGLVDTYTVTYTDGDTMTYTVTNGADGTMEVIDIGTVTTSGQTIALTKAQYDKLTASGVTCLVKLTYSSNDYYMQRNYEGGGYYHYGDRFIASAGGYVDFNVTIYQSGADYEAQFTITNAIIVNPTLAGTETALSGLQVNGTKYKIDAGGTTLTQRQIIGQNTATGTRIYNVVKNCKGRVLLYDTYRQYNANYRSSDNKVVLSSVWGGTYGDKIEFRTIEIDQYGGLSNCCAGSINYNSGDPNVSFSAPTASWSSSFGNSLICDYWNDTAF